MDENKFSWKEEIFDLVKTFVVCLLIVFLLTTFVAKPVRVDGKSMYPTLKDSEIGFMNMFLIKTEGIQRQDVVIVHNDRDDENWVKRIIGLPGDTIYAKNDVVYVNDQPLQEPYLETDYVKQLRANGQVFTRDFGPITLLEDEYFVMGDNRLYSYDSREPSVGPFHKDDIVGKDVYVIYPFEEFKMVRNGNPQS